VLSQEAVSAGALDALNPKCQAFMNMPEIHSKFAAVHNDKCNYFSVRGWSMNWVLKGSSRRL
jgi:hypothetical protein